MTKWRGDAAISDGTATVRSGKIDGLGFYLFARREGQNLDGTTVHNDIAPFVYSRLSLIDVATSRTVHSQVIRAGRPFPSLTPQEQIDRLVEMLAACTKDAVPHALRAT